MIDALVPIPPRPQQQAAPGWYADHTARVQRYWDDRAWTEHVAPLAPPTVVVNHPAPTSNPKATAGFVLGIIATLLNFLAVPAALAITFSSVGLARAYARGMPKRRRP